MRLIPIALKKSGKKSIPKNQIMIPAGIMGIFVHFSAIGKETQLGKQADYYLQKIKKVTEEPVGKIEGFAGSIGKPEWNDEGHQELLKACMDAMERIEVRRVNILQDSLFTWILLLGFLCLRLTLPATFQTAFPNFFGVIVHVDITEILLHVFRNVVLHSEPLQLSFEPLDDVCVF